MGSLRRKLARQQPETREQLTKRVTRIREELATARTRERGIPTEQRTILIARPSKGAR